MGLQTVKVEGIDFATNITPPAASSSLDFIGYGEVFIPSSLVLLFLHPCSKVSAKTQIMIHSPLKTF